MDIRHLDPKARVVLPALATEPVPWPPIRAEAHDLHPQWPCVWRVRNLLSPGECDALVAALEPALEGRPAEDAAYRDAARVVLHPECGTDVARVLQHRLQRFGDALSARHDWPGPVGFVSAVGPDWAPPDFAINPCLRVSKYAPGSAGFAPHRDAPFTVSACEASDCTVVLCLQESAAGGQLQVWGPASNHLAVGLTPAEELAAAVAVVPGADTPHLLAPLARGDAFIFHQSLMHGATGVPPGPGPAKIVLRTDLVRTRGLGPLKAFGLEGVFEPTRGSWPALRVAQDLFRAAELWEVRGVAVAAAAGGPADLPALVRECYERSLSLRQHTCPGSLREDDIAPAAVALAARAVEDLAGVVGADTAPGRLTFKSRTATVFVFQHGLTGPAFAEGPALCAVVVLAAKVAHEFTTRLVAQALGTEDQLTFSWSKDAEAVLGRTATPARSPKPPKSWSTAVAGCRTPSPEGGAGKPARKLRRKEAEAPPVPLLPKVLAHFRQDVSGEVSSDSESSDSESPFWGDSGDEQDETDDEKHDTPWNSSRSDFTERPGGFVQDKLLEVLGQKGVLVACAPADALRVVVSTTVARRFTERIICGIGGSCDLPDKRTQFRVSEPSMHVADGADAAATVNCVPTVTFDPRGTSANITGTVRFLAPVEAFNHASCQCYFETVERSEVRFKVHTMVWLNMTFTATNTGTLDIRVDPQLLL